MSTYFIAQIKIRNADEYQKYLDGFDEVFSRYKGEVVVVDDSPTVLEGEWRYTRIVLIRFPHRAAAESWYRSPQYQELAKYRHAASSADIIFAEGVD